MAITIDAGIGKVVIFSKGLGSWDDDPMHFVTDEERARIERNAKRSLEAQGYRVEVDSIH